MLGGGRVPLEDLDLEDPPRELGLVRGIVKSARAEISYILKVFRVTLCLDIFGIRMS